MHRSNRARQTARLLHVDAPAHRRTIPCSEITTVELRNKMLETGP